MFIYKKQHSRRVGGKNFLLKTQSYYFEYTKRTQGKLYFEQCLLAFRVRQKLLVQPVEIIVLFRS